VFKYAVTKGYLTTMPTGSAPSAKSVRRPTFTLNEWRVLSRKMREWVAAAQSKVIMRDRFVAHQAFLILANTGMRIGELRGLRWSDLRTVKTEDGTRLVAYVRGKTGAREVVFQQGADEYVKRLYDMRQREVLEAAGDGATAPLDRNQFVVCHPDGSAIQTMKRSFESLLKFAGISAQRDGGTRTLYSLRHFYATQRLSHETSPFLLAKQMGTSVEMLEKFYGQTVTSSLAAEVSKSRSRQTQSNGKRYPFE
jgi:integrase